MGSIKEDYIYSDYQAHTEWEEVPDETLVALAQSNDPLAREAADFLLERFKLLVRIKTRPFFLMGADRTDLIQEGMIGLYMAIMNYSPEKNTSFKTFAGLCIGRHIMDVLRMTCSKKHSILNEYVSFDMTVQDDGEKEVTMADLIADERPTPEEEVISRETAEYIQKALFEACSPFEASVLQLYLQGFDYNIIAKKLSKTPRNIDNALQRIKKKCADIVKKIQEE